MGLRAAAVQFKYPMAKSDLPLAFPMASFQAKLSHRQHYTALTLLVHAPTIRLTSGLTCIVD